MRNVKRHAGQYLARVHSMYSDGRHEQIKVTLTEYDILCEVEQYEAQHGPAGPTPRRVVEFKQSEFLSWWNQISEDTTCSCGVMPKLELLARL